jgi:hypothetical protein
MSTGQRRRADRLRTSGCASFVAMVKSTHFRECHHATFRRRLDASWRGCVLLEGEMSSRPMVVEQIRGHETSQVPLAEYDHMVQAFSPD